MTEEAVPKPEEFDHERMSRVVDLNFNLYDEEEVSPQMEAMRLNKIKKTLFDSPLTQLAGDLRVLNKYARESVRDPKLQDEADQWESTSQIVSSVIAQRLLESRVGIAKQIDETKFSYDGKKKDN